uniref:E3 ubiquitin protein ligase n=1 Tax=Panagrellus redivivus TaxID=6233 RepID=A0A7E4UUC9_PANRE
MSSEETDPVSTQAGSPEKQVVVAFDVPVFFKEPKLPPIVFHLHEIKDIHGVDVMYPHYRSLAQVKMESSLPMIQDEIRDLEYLLSVYKPMATDLEAISKVVNGFFKNFTERELYYESSLSNSNFHHRIASLCGDFLFDRQHNDPSGIRTALQSAHIKTHEFWRPNDLALFMLIRILSNVAKALPDTAESDHVLSKLRQIGVNADDFLTIATEHLLRSLQHRDSATERFSTSYYAAKNVTSADAVKNEYRRAKRIYPHVVGLRNMGIEENLQALDECYRVGMEVKPMEKQVKQIETETVKVPASFVPECLKKIAEGKAFIKAAEVERQALIEQRNKLIETKLRQAVRDKHKEISIRYYARRSQWNRLKDAKQKLRKQRSYKLKLLRRRCYRIRDTLDVIKAEKTECLPILKERALQYATKVTSQNAEFEKQLKIRAEILEVKLLREVAQGHQSGPSLQQFVKHVDAVKQAVIKRDNPKINLIERKKKVLEKAKVDEQEAKNFLRHSIVIPCSLPSNLKPPFLKIDPAKAARCAVLTTPPVSKTLQALAETHRRRVDGTPSSSKRVLPSLAEVSKTDRTEISRKRPQEHQIEKTPTKRYRTHSSEAKADISLTELDELLEQSFPTPPKPVPKQLTIQQIHPLTREARISLRSLTPDQVPLFMRSVLPVTPQRPLHASPEAQNPATISAWMHGHGFDDAKDPPDAPWRKWLGVLTMKHLLRYSIHESRRQLAIQAQKDLRNETVFPEMIPRQIQRSIDDAKHVMGEVAKKNKLTENLVKAKSSTATECFKILADAKEPLQNLHAAEEVNLTNFKEKARLQNSHMITNEHVQVLQKWNGHLRDYKTACIAMKAKNDKVLTDVDRLTRTSERDAIVADDRKNQLNQAIQLKRVEVIEKRKECAALRAKFEDLANKYIAKYKTAINMKSELQKRKMELKGIKADLAESKAEEADEFTQKMHKYYQGKVNCPLCKTRQRDAAFSKCFHLFCKECVDTVVQSRSRRCPTCSIRVSAKDAVRVYL